MTATILANATCVSVSGRGLLIEGPPESGKSSLALALLDRGAILVGDDAVALECREGQVWALPPPNITGLLEISGVGIVTFPVCEAPLSLVLTLEKPVDRLPVPGERNLLGIGVPCLAFTREGRSDLRAEWALRTHGLPSSGGGR